MRYLRHRKQYLLHIKRETLSPSHRDGMFIEQEQQQGFATPKWVEC